MRTVSSGCGAIRRLASGENWRGFLLYKPFILTTAVKPCGLSWPERSPGRFICIRAVSGATSEADHPAERLTLLYLFISLRIACSLFQGFYLSAGKSEAVSGTNHHATTFYIYLTCFHWLACFCGGAASEVIKAGKGNTLKQGSTRAKLNFTGVTFVKKGLNNVNCTFYDGEKPLNSRVAGLLRTGSTGIKSTRGKGHPETKKGHFLGASNPQKYSKIFKKPTIMCIHFFSPQNKKKGIEVPKNTAKYKHLS